MDLRVLNYIYLFIVFIDYKAIIIFPYKFYIKYYIRDFYTTAEKDKNAINVTSN
jgi:hypothetical protein